MNLQPTLPIKGRGSANNPVNRFIPIQYEQELDLPEEERPSPRTQLFVDHAKSILSQNDSPDLFFRHSLNPYRGCEHGCTYCFARPTHEYLGLSSGLDFETKIMVKLDAPKLLRKELCRPSRQPSCLMLSGVTDCYQPIERKFTLTRQCLQVLAEFRHPVGIVTKNHLVCRDIDVITELAQYQAASVAISLTTLDAGLAGKLEPRASAPHARLAAIRELSAANIPVGILVAPTIPGLNDHEVPEILAAAREAGALFASYTVLRLPYAIKDLFSDWLQQHFPERKEKVLGRVRDLRGGKLYDSRFGIRMRGQGIWADLFRQQFTIHKKRLAYPERPPPLSTVHFRRPGDQQGTLF